jgi:hypothetical protein
MVFIELIEIIDRFLERSACEWGIYYSLLDKLSWLATGPRITLCRMQECSENPTWLLDAEGSEPIC